MDPVEATPHAEVPTETLATLVEISEKINASLDLDEVLAQAAALVRRLIDYEIFAVLLLDKQANQLYFRFDIGHRREVVESWRVPVGQGITGAAAATRQAILVPDVRNDPRYINVLDPVCSELAVPLLYKGECVGVLDIQSTQFDYFKPEHQAILTLLASRLVGAIENARLFEFTSKQAETLLLLNEVGREASAILDVERLLQRAAELTKRIIDYQIFSIMLYDEADDVFRQRISVKYGQSVRQKFQVPARAGIAGGSVALRQPVIVPDVGADPRYVQCNPETRSELVVPMFHQSRVIGVLDLESPQLNYFTEEHAQALSILGANLAVSLENARLYQQVARGEARMERELQAARRIQGALLPPLPSGDYGLDIAARYISARELGGDLYDFLRYGAHQLGIALGDVSGKGTAAALYGAVAIGILRSLAPRKLQPAAVLRELNQLVCERKIESRFMTLCFATWQANRRRLRIANAGQSQPLLWKSGRCERLKIEGFPLGMFEDATYDEWGVTLAPGDILVLYSDGLVENLNDAGEQFGTNRLARLISENVGLSAAELADRILESTYGFSEGAFAHDDRTLVVVKVR
jgi:sigma-B regulation protein RsbU (phosphoserine phosphatase)